MEDTNQTSEQSAPNDTQGAAVPPAEPAPAQTLSDETPQNPPAAPAPAPVPAVETVPPVEDTVVLAAPKEPEAAPVVSATDVVDADGELVTSLKTQMAAFKRAVLRPGKVPEDYKEAAKLSARMTKFIVQYPKVPVLDAYLAFVTENLDEACSAKNYLKGTTTLQAADERQVAFLYNLFHSLAEKSPMNLRQTEVLSVLKKQEIVGYYNRRVAAMNKA